MFSYLLIGPLEGKYVNGSHLGDELLSWEIIKIWKIGQLRKFGLTPMEIIPIEYKQSKFLHYLLLKTNDQSV